MMKNLFFSFLAIFMALSQNAFAQWETFTDTRIPNLVNQSVKYKGQYFALNSIFLFKSKDLSTLSNDLSTTLIDIKHNKELDLLWARSSSKIYLYDDITGSLKFIDANLVVPSGTSISDFCFKGTATYVSTSAGIYENPNTDPDKWKFLSPDSIKTAGYSKIDIVDDSLLIASGSSLTYAHSYNLNSKKWTRINILDAANIFIKAKGLFAYFPTNKGANFKKYNFVTKTWQNWGKIALGAMFVGDMTKIGQDFYITGRGFIKKSSDNGNTWKDFLIFNDAYNFVYSINETNNGFIAATTGGVYETIDNGVTWKNYTIAKPLNNLAVSKRDMHTLDNTPFMSYSYGVFKYNEITKKVEQHSKGLPYPFANAYLNKSNNKLFAYETYHGLYSLDKADGTWAKVNTPTLGDNESLSNIGFANKDTMLLETYSFTGAVLPNKYHYSTNNGVTWINTSLNLTTFASDIFYQQKTFFMFLGTTVRRYEANKNIFSTKTLTGNLATGTHYKAINYKNQIVLGRSNGVFITDTTFQNVVQVTTIPARTVFEHNNRIYIGANTTNDTTKIYGTDDLKTTKSYRGNINKNSGSAIRSFAIDKNYLYAQTLQGIEMFYRRPLSSLVNTFDISEIEPAKVYPNPAQTYIIVSNKAFVATETYDYEVFDVTGKLFANGKVNGENNLEMNIQSLPSGSYYIKINGKKYIYTSQFIKM